LSSRPSFSKYGKSFQEDLVHLILDDRPFADQILEVLDTNFLELEYLRLFTSKIVNYRQRYSKHPTQQIIDTILQTELEKEDRVVSQQITEYFSKISVSEVEGSEYIKEQSLDFCRKQNLKEAMLKSVDLLQSCSFDEISNIINDSLKLGSENNFGYDYLVDFEERYLPRFRNPVTTGWQQMDEIVGGGLGKSELGVVIAPTGAGKSMVLVHLGSHAIKEGKTVVHYTLELQDTVIGKRYDSCITEFPLSELSVFKEDVYEKIKDLDGRLIVKEYPTKSATTGTIRNHLNKLIKRGINPGMIIVDYADLLKPIVVRKEKRNELESIYEELRALSTEFGCPIWTASQTNRSGLNAEVITMEQISEAFNKCFVADFIFSVSRTIEDKQNNTGKIFVAKNRNGPDGMIYDIFMDTASVKIRVLPRNTTGTVGNNNNVVTSPVVLTPKMQRNHLQTKYQKFKGTTK